MAAVNSQFCDTRKVKNIQRSLAALLGESTYSRLSGNEDTNDEEHGGIDPDPSMDLRFR